MSSLWILTLFAVTVALVHATPIDNVWAGGRLETANKYECFDLPEYISCYCGYSVTVLPNARGHKTVNEAFSEFLDFVGLLTDDPCSDQIGAFLCFEYFPFHAGPDKDTNCGASGTIIRPCNDTCQLAKNEACTDIVQLHTNSTRWAPHLECDNFPSPNGEEACAKSDAIIKKNISSCLYPTATTEKPAETEPATTEKPTEVTTEKPTEVTTTEKGKLVGGVGARSSHCS